MFLTAERGDGCTPYDSRSDKEKTMKIVDVLVGNGSAHPGDFGDSQFFEYDVGDAVVYVESTAPILMGEILRRPVYFQNRLFGALIKMLKVGEHVPLEGEDRRSKARVVRLEVNRSANSYSLLITR